jgi:hypothetical protein
VEIGTDPYPGSQCAVTSLGHTVPRLCKTQDPYLEQGEGYSNPQNLKLARLLLTTPWMLTASRESLFLEKIKPRSICC